MKAIEILKELCDGDPAFGVLKIFAMVGSAVILAIFIALAIAVWKLSLGLCS